MLCCFFYKTETYTQIHTHTHTFKLKLFEIKMSGVYI